MLTAMIEKRTCHTFALRININFKLVSNSSFKVAVQNQSQGTLIRSFNLGFKKRNEQGSISVHKAG